MNILIFNWRDPKNPKAGGAEYVTQKHAKAWVLAGHNVTWFTSSFPGAKEEEVWEGITIIRRGNEYIIHLLAVFYYLFHKNNIDLIIDEVHGYPFFTPLYANKPIVAFIHEVAGNIWDYMFPFPINTAGKLLESIYFRMYKGIPFWTDAPSTVDEIVSYGIPRSNCVAIACPIDVHPLVALPTKPKDPVFIFISRMVKMKGIEDVLLAFVLIKKDLPNATFSIIGDGERSYKKRLQKITEEHGISQDVSFLGYVSEKEKYLLLKKAHILLHASVKEGWGLVVLEAASQATPSIVYNVPGLKDIVMNGKTGIITKKNTPQELAAEAVLLWRNQKKYETLQRQSLVWLKSFSWEKSTKQSLSLITRVAADWKRK